MSQQIANQLIRTLSESDRALLGDVEHVELGLRFPIENANEQIEHVYFPTSGMISVVARAGDEQIEVGVIGREGMTAMAVVMGNHRSPNDAYVQIAGTAFRSPAQRVRQAIEESRSFRQLVQRYMHVFTIQVAQTALANGRAKIEERLARWLVMAHDRIDDNDITLTHEFIATMLGVRRPGITDAIHELEGKNLIRSTRGAIRVIDREGLRAIAGAAYGVTEAEYVRLIG